MTALAVNTMIIGLDVTVLNLALPTLAVKLNASSGDLQWFVDACTRVFAAAATALAVVLLPVTSPGQERGAAREGWTW